MPPAPTPTPAPVSMDPIKDMALEIARVRRELTSSVEDARNLTKEFKLSSAELKTSFELSTDTKNALDDTRSVISRIGREYVDQQLILERINTNEVERAVVQDELETGLINMGRLLAGQTMSLADQAILHADIETRLNSSIDTVRATVDAQQLAVFNLMNEIKARNVIEAQLEKANTLVDSGNNKVKEMQLKASALSRIFGSLTGIPFLKDFMDFKKISDAFAISTKEGFKSLGGEVKRVLSNPLFLSLIAITAVIAAFKALIKLAFDYDKIITDISNNTGIAKDTTIDLLDSFRAISSEGAKLVGSLDSAFLSVKNQANAMLELQETMETNVLFTNERIQNEILLTKQMKMSKEEASGIQKLSLITGQSAEKILNTAMKQNNTAISYRKIFAEIAKVNSEISVAYKNNPELIAKAVIEANKLGMSLEQTKNISKSLLDFETSISGELEAELLLGKRFNFEKARALALDGKSAEAATELIGQMGGLNALTNMNVIQRERLAASIGMSAEELTKSAQEQAVLNALGVENKNALEERYEILRKNGDLAGMERLKAEAAKKEGGELLLQDIAKANLQDRFNESMEQLKQIFTELSTALIPMIEGLASMLSNTTLLKIVMASLVGMAAAIATSMVIATGGAALVGAAVAGVAVGGLSYLGMSATGGAGEAALPIKKPNLPTYNNNQGNGAAGDQRSDEKRRFDISLNIDGKPVSTALKISDYSYS
jgi:hypothetical protein